MAEKRYYSPDDSEAGVTREELAQLNPEGQRAYIVAWFGSMFEDPAQETPYNGREGGYQYIWGGPYDARDEIETEFSDIVSQEVLDEAVDEVEADGISDWAPGPSHPDHARAAEEYYESFERPPDFEDAIRHLEAGAMPILGAGAELEARAELSVSANELVQMLVAATRARGNGPQSPTLGDWAVCAAGRRKGGDAGGGRSHRE